MIVCHCLAVRERELRRRIREGHTSLRALARATGAGTGCGGCHRQLAAILASERHPRPRDLDEASPAAAAAR